MHPWNKECDEAFKRLKQHLASPPLLKRPEKGHVLCTYLVVSPHAISVVLVKEEGITQHPVYYAGEGLGIHLLSPINQKGYYMATLTFKVTNNEVEFDELVVGIQVLVLMESKCKDNLEAYSTELKDLAMKILDQMAKALRMESSDMRCIFEEGIQTMRMNYYPPCPQPELAICINAHSDAGGLTILLQLNEMQGLQ
ncbi:1-aminocyclopropane-1-carboxylate oxidase 4-like [Carya illinoinensis]|uniref:1-aminocyclopropane-1-carboxylate oxidase 4-like n=1 Tax=Carya illinoinensis TaxID=32201 RepID=UPI001C727DE2|nr:1-aminocyclopropane-1-carboxylate oxidase 4-like [Carya illinoinensis]